MLKMTYNQLKKTFLDTRKVKIRYRHNGKSVFLVKRPTRSPIRVVYVATCETDEAGKEIWSKKRVAGYLNCRNEFVYPTESFLTQAIDPTDQLRVTDPRIEVRDALRKEVLRQAKMKPKPQLSEKEMEDIYRFAEAWVYAGLDDADKDYCDYGPSCTWMTLSPSDYSRYSVSSGKMCEYICYQGVIDMLAGTPHWAETAAERWMNTRLPNASPKIHISKTFGDVLVHNITVTNTVLRLVSKLRHDSSAPVHQYIAMKDATARVRDERVKVKYAMKDGRAGEGEIPAEYFQFSPMVEDVSKISLSMAKTPSKRILLRQLLPANARWLAKTDITEIRYEGQVLWKAAPEPDEEPALVHEPHFAVQAV